MRKKIAILLITTLTLVSNVYAGSDGELILKKNEPSKIKDCSEKFNRTTFAFNQALDGAIFQPVASVYRKLPSPIRTGTGNALNNLSNLITIPNNILQGDLRSAANNSARLIINTTLGIAGIFDPANSLGFEKEIKKILDKRLEWWGSEKVVI